MKHATKDEVESAIDKAVNKGVIHRNKAVRMKSKYERSHSRSTQ
jgi:ribosomal protein S20